MTEPEARARALAQAEADRTGVPWAVGPHGGPHRWERGQCPTTGCTRIDPAPKPSGLDIRDLTVKDGDTRYSISMTPPPPLTLRQRFALAAPPCQRWYYDHVGAETIAEDFAAWAAWPWYFADAVLAAENAPKEQP